ncbi:MAG: AtpZ/AtpI family protein [Bacteroidota bacterium]|jgi:F0F1-type ATP synthase assembly protein I
MSSEPPSDNSENEKKKSDIQSIYREYGQYLTLGFQLAAAIVVFFFLGDWIDKRYGIAPVGKLVGTLIGMVGGFIKFFKSVTSMIADQDRIQKSNKHED